MSETCDVIVQFGKIPTIRDAFVEKLFSITTWQEMMIWFPSVWTAGRYAHCYFAHAGVTYDVSNMPTSKSRQIYNDKLNLTYTYKIRVLRKNVAKATLLCEEANANHWRHPISNCTHTISMLIYGEPNHYTWFGSFGWATRKVLRDVQQIEASQR